MQFVVPQFIDVEDKVLGPLSVRQFVIILGGAGFIFLLFKLFDFFTFAVSAVFVLLLVFLFAFIKINGRGFHMFLLSLFQTYRRPQLKVWQKDLESFLYQREPIKKSKRAKYIPKQKGSITSSRLTQMALVVDTGGSYNLEDEANSDENVTSEKITTLEI